MTDFDVEPTSMHGVADRISRLPGEVDAAIQTLMRTVGQYVDLNKGTAADAYQAAQLQWNQGLGQVREGAGQAAPILHNIADEFLDGDRRAAGQYPG
ncbi:WXG100 family type VII secretion target [Micromonospora sp. NPDC050276]|uniref:WXG100 family type VII secretion target n=1 Tax=Micromonospora sp. NPDC050276 TaxID=3364278 RepID=UPI0037A5CE38